MKRKLGDGNCAYSDDLTLTRKRDLSFFFLKNKNNSGENDVKILLELLE
jgi:hypothetical protein